MEDSNGLGVGKNGAKHITDDGGVILHNRVQWLKLSGLQGLTFILLASPLQTRCTSE